MSDEATNTAMGTPVAPAIQPAPVAPTQVPTPVSPPTPPPAPAGRPKLQLSNDDLNERLRRAKSSALKELFGTDDVAKLRQLKTRAEELERTAEEQKRAQMSEIERMKYDLDRQKQFNAQLQDKLRRVSEREVVREQQKEVERIATRHVNPLYVEEAALAFARDIAAKNPREVARMTEKDIAKWFQKYVERKPAFAASPNARKVKTLAGARTPAPRPHQPANAQTNGGKSFKPGQANSMSREEARQEAGKLGYHW